MRFRIYKGEHCWYLEDVLNGVVLPLADFWSTVLQAWYKTGKVWSAEQFDATLGIWNTSENNVTGYSAFHCVPSAQAVANDTHAYRLMAPRSRGAWPHTIQL